MKAYKEKDDVIFGNKQIISETFSEDIRAEIAKRKPTLEEFIEMVREDQRKRSISQRIKSLFIKNNR